MYQVVKINIGDQVFISIVNKKKKTRELREGTQFKRQCLDVLNNVSNIKILIKTDRSVQE